MINLETFGFVIPIAPPRPVTRPQWDRPFCDYYALIELPSRRHIPAPIVERHLGRWVWLQVRDRMTMSHKVRDWHFFYCGECRNLGRAGRSFYRCHEHRPMSFQEDLSKFEELTRILDDDRPEALEYVRSYHPTEWC